MTWLARREREGEARSKARVVSETPPLWASRGVGGRRVDGVNIFRANFYFMSS